ncbi:hypothetical protein SAMN06272755_2838 [Picosynechococcus sp. OG1]|nr:hypothetical protein SAMN06272755_2838 [Picosynechococcus sp. OG1]SMQ83009.1 hypothetical protein SAMN06272774_2114 [Synechococcus sp. 7002]
MKVGDQSKSKKRIKFFVKTPDLSRFPGKYPLGIAAWEDEIHDDITATVAS